MFDLVASWSIRYFDMLFSRLVAADDDRHRVCVLRELQRRLAGRVAGADDVDVEAMHARGVALRGTVEHALPDEAVEPLDREPPPADTARKDDRARREDVTRLEAHPTRSRVDLRDRLGHEDLCAEALRLLERAGRELVAGDAVREAEVVLDPGRRAGLATWRLALDHEHAQPFRGAVDGGCQPGGPAAHDDDVVLVGLRLRPEAEQLRHASELGPQDRLRLERQQVGHLTHMGPDHGIALEDADRRELRRRPGGRSPHSRAPRGRASAPSRSVMLLRSRKRRTSAHDPSQRWPTTIARRGEGDDARP